MPAEYIPIGPVVKLLANVAYALPAPKVTLFTDATTPTVTLSNNKDFTGTPVPAVFTNGMASFASAFMKSTADMFVVAVRD